VDLIALAIAPGLAICIFIFTRDIYNREPALNLLMSFFYGVLSIIPAFFIESFLDKQVAETASGIAIKSFFIIALTEEACKFIVLRYYAYRQKSFDEPFDGIVYSVMVSMGFATLENILYVYGSAQTGQGYQVAFMRMFLSVPAHATFGVLMGYHVGRAKFEPLREKRLMLLGLFWAVLFHGIFDTLLFWQQSPQITQYASEFALFGGAVVSFILAFRLSMKLIYKHRLFSQRKFRPTEKLNLRRANESDIPLIRDLSERIWPQTYATILSTGQIDHMMNMMYSEVALREQLRKNNEFVIVNDGRDPIGFASFGLESPGIYKLHKIYILPNMQRKGVGRFVIDQICAAMKRKGALALQLNVNRNNEAVRFYQSMGFEIIREEDNDIGNGFFMNDYVMEKKTIN
jgi:RsiW-degrading membrane proteinase PrsW (M82 family)/ribosomal protein S18 acetylase RimI-like enzyme